MQIGNIEEFWSKKQDNRVVRINLSYTFGQRKAGRMRSAGTYDEKGRININ